jgi:hypothetical protein
MVSSIFEVVGRESIVAVVVVVMVVVVVVVKDKEAVALLVGAKLA